MGRGYKNYLLNILMVLLAFNYMDRLALGIVLQGIKADLHLTDTQLGLLGGIAFAFFYSVMGIPIARWADRGNRVTVIWVTAALWSVAVALCGAALTFLQLLGIRVAVAVGEAGCIPPAHSLIADYFDRAERPKAVARYALGGPLALVIGYLAAGWLNELYGWRETFVVLGLPGLVLAALARFTLEEPRKLKTSAENIPREETLELASPPERPSINEVCSTLWEKPAFRHLLICYSVWYFFNYGVLQWIPSFFIRSHSLQTGELGTWLALIYGIGGGLGMYLGGVWATRFAAGNERLQLRVCVLAFAFHAVLNVAVFMASSQYLAFAALALGNFGGSIVMGPTLATIQTLVPSRMRATSISLVYLFANLIGLGLGPFATGALSDSLRPIFGDESLRYALLTLCPGYLWAAWHVWRASQTVANDIKSSQLDDRFPDGVNRAYVAV